MLSTSAASLKLQIYCIKACFFPQLELKKQSVSLKAVHQSRLNSLINAVEIACLCTECSVTSWAVTLSVTPCYIAIGCKSQSLLNWEGPVHCSVSTNRSFISLCPERFHYWPGCSRGLSEGILCVCFCGSDRGRRALILCRMLDASAAVFKIKSKTHISLSLPFPVFTNSCHFYEPVIHSGVCGSKEEVLQSCPSLTGTVYWQPFRQVLWTSWKVQLEIALVVLYGSSKL